MKMKMEKGKRLIALALSFMMVFSYMPFFNGTVHAATDNSTSYIELYTAADATTTTDTYTYDNAGTSIYIRANCAESSGQSWPWIGIFKGELTCDTWSKSTQSLVWAYTNQGETNDYSQSSDAYYNGSSALDITESGNYAEYRLDSVFEPGIYTIILFKHWETYGPVTYKQFTVTGEPGSEVPDIPEADYISTDKTTYSYGEPIQVTTTYNEYPEKDWVGIWTKGNYPSGDSLAYYYVRSNPDTQDCNTDDTSKLNNLSVVDSSYYLDGHLKAGEYTIAICKNDLAAKDGGSVESTDITIIADTPYKSIVTEPTCTAGGYTTDYYGDGTTKVRDEVSALEHQWSAWVYDSHTKTHTRTCSVSTHDAEVGDCTFELFGNPVEDAAGITKTYKCTVCEGTYEEFVASGYKFVRNVTEPATCEADGRTYELWVNEAGEGLHVNEVVLTKKGHAWSDWAPVGDNPVTHSRVCANDANHVETGICETVVSYGDGKEYYTCKDCEHQTATTMISLDKQVYDTGEEILATTHYMKSSTDWLGLFYEPNGGYPSGHPTDTSKGYVYITSNPQTFKVNEKSTYTIQGNGEEYFPNDTLMHGNYTLALVRENNDAANDQFVYIRFKVCSFNAGTVIEEATCNEEGSKLFTCKICDETKTEVIPALGHEWNDGEVQTAPTCADAGLAIQRCQRDDCGITQEVVVDSLGHDLDEGTITTEPTCQTEGVKTFKCQRDGCNHEETEPVSTEFAEHDWDEGELTTDPTCSTPGIMTYSCQTTGCNVTNEEVIEGLNPENHAGYKGIVTEPTCTEQGFTTYTCLCGDSYVDDYTDPTGHEWNDGVITTPSTCQTKGEMLFTCTVDGCGKTENRPMAIDPDNHDYNEGIVTKVPTCTEKGELTQTCQREGCGNPLVTPIDEDKDNHNYESVVTDPTCTEKGYTTYTCTRCKDEYKDDYVDSKHILKTQEFKPTCDEDGYTLYTCECGAIEYSTPGEAALGHDFDKGKVTKVPTCTEKGELTQTCKRENCGEPKVTPLDADMNNHDYKSVVTKPTCTKDGYTTHICARCEDKKVEEGAAALKHKWDAGKITKAPTCTEKGVKTYTCVTCSEIKNEAIDKSAHKAVKKQTTKATVSKAGKIEQKCTCGKVMSTTPIAKVSIVKLSKTSYTYDGKVKSPTITIKDSNNKVLKKGTDYEVTTPKGRKNAGKYTYKITFEGKYSGTKNLTFAISPKKITKATLGATIYTYNGKLKKPTVTVKAGTLTVAKKSSKSNGNVKITYATGRKNVGKYKVTIKGTGNYTGTITKTFKINPAKPAIKKPVAAKKVVTVKWGQVKKQATGYEIMIATNSKFTKNKKTITVKNYKTVSKKVTGLKGKTTYHVKVRAYKTVGKVKYTSAWSATKTVKTK